MKPDAIGKIIALGFGDRVLIGVLMGFLTNVSLERCYEYIRDDLSLLHWVSDDDWEKYRKWVKQVNAGDITRDRVIAELKKHHPEHLSIIINTEGGNEWLDRQITEMKHKLEVE